MGIVKLSITIMILIWTIYSINTFVLWWNYEPTDEKEENLIAEFLLKEHRLCVDGAIYWNETGLICDRGRVKIVYSCIDECIRDINVRE